MRNGAFLNAREAAHFLRIKLPTLYSWVHQRRIPYRKHGSKLVFSCSDLENWSCRTLVEPVSALTVCDRKGLMGPHFRPSEGAKRSLTTRKTAKTKQIAIEAPKLRKES